MAPKLASFKPVLISGCCGFAFSCGFYDDCGKDASMDRWRVVFYYKPSYAIVKFFDSESAKNEFLLGLNPVAEDYDVWKTNFKQNDN